MRPTKRREARGRGRRGMRLFLVFLVGCSLGSPLDDISAGDMTQLNAQKDGIMNACERTSSPRCSSSTYPGASRP